jgi:hypothetical protein
MPAVSPLAAWMAKRDSQAAWARPPLTVRPDQGPPGTLPGGPFRTQKRTVAVSRLARGAPASKVW